MMLEVQPAAGPLRGSLRVPGDKSISHRALILGGLADGRTKITGLLESADTAATRRAMEQLGARFWEEQGRVQVEGVGGGSGLSAPSGPVDMGNSGTAMRLLAGVLAAQPFGSVLTGDSSLRRRPMARIIRPLERMGASIEARENGRPPLRIRGNPRLRAISYESPVASAQVKSCVLLAGLFARGETCVSEPRLSRDHTERMLPAFGVEIDAEQGGAICLHGPQALHGTDVLVPGDPSSAAFPAAAALLVPGSEVTLRGVGMNPTRTAFFEALRAMGAKLDVEPRDGPGREPVGDLNLRADGPLRGIDLPPEWIPAMIDEIPILLALAATAEGVTRIREAGELRVKESDRLAVMAKGLARMGITVREYEDGIDVVGGRPKGARVDGAQDHRCAMSFAVLAQVCDGPSLVEGAGYIDTSYPNFLDQFHALGARLGPAEELA